MNNHKAKVAIIFLQFTFALLAMGAEPIAESRSLVVEDNQSTKLSPFVDYYQSASPQSSFYDVTTKYWSEFKPYRNPQYAQDFGLTNDTLWLRFLLNNKNNDSTSTYLEIGNPILEDVELYLLRQSGDEYFVLRKEGKVQQIMLPVNNDVFEIKLQANEQLTVLLRARSATPLFVPLNLYTGHAYYEETYKARLLESSVFGLYIGLLVLNFYLWFTSKDISYLYIILIGLGNFLIQAIFLGYTSPFYPMLSVHPTTLLSFCGVMTLTCGVQLARHYMATKQYWPRMDRVFQFCFLFLLFVSFPLVFFGGYFATMMSLAPSALFFMGAQIVVAIKIMRLGYFPAKIYLIASVIPILSGFWTIGIAVGAVPPIGNPQITQLVSNAIYLILFSIAAGYRVNHIVEEKRLAELDVIRAVAEAHAKSEFLAGMSHEIRTPMNGVIAMSGLLKESITQEKQKEYVDAIFSSGKVLLYTINAILDYSKIEAGKMEVEHAPFDIADIINDCAETYGSYRNRANFIFFCSIQPGMPSKVIGDVNRLRQVLMNLIDNAFKYTEVGTVSVRVEWEKLSDKACHYTFEILDTGDGINEADRHKIFGQFSEVQHLGAEKKRGIGLGLAIAKQLTDLMGGRIYLESEVGVGSRFYVEVPLEFDLAYRGVVDSDSEHDAREVLNREILSDKKILFVDDSVEWCEVVKEAITAWGAEVNISYQAEQALGLILSAGHRESPYDLIITDLDLGGMNGVQLATQISLRRNLTSAPIMLLTGTSVLPSKYVLEQAGIKYAHIKPAIVSSLRELILAALTGSQLVKEPVVTQDGQDTPADYSSLLVLVAEDNLVNQLVIKGVLKKIGIKPVIAENGQKAIEAFSKIPGGFDLVLMDCEMPVCDGFEATSKIKKMSKKMKTKIVGLSAHSAADYQTYCLEQGMDGYLEKPVKFEQLKSLLDELRAAS